MCDDAWKKAGAVDIDQRHETSVGLYKVYMTTDVFMHRFTAVADESYPARVVWKVVEDLKMLAKRKFEGLSTDKLKAEIKQLLLRNKNAAEVDKLYAVNMKSDQVKVQLQDNMTDLLKNQTDIEVVLAQAASRNKYQSDEGSCRWLPEEHQ